MVRRRPLLFAPLLPLLAHCGGPPKPPPPPSLVLTIRAGRDQNPASDGKPAPVVVRVLELAATGAFEHADIFALIERESATLGADLLQAEQAELAPGETRVLKRMLKPGAQFLGVAVLFRDIDRARWRATAALAPSGPTRLTLSIGALAAQLS